MIPTEGVMDGNPWPFFVAHDSTEIDIPE